MPLTENRDPIGMQRMLENANAPYKGLDWEPADLLPESFLEAFEREYSAGIARKTVREGKVHRDFTTDGKLASTGSSSSMLCMEIWLESLKRSRLYAVTSD